MKKMLKRSIWKIMMSAFVIAMLCGGVTAFAAGGVSAGLNSLRSRFPDQAFWNHKVTAVSNNADNLMRNWDESFANSITNQPCYTHSSEAPVGTIDCNYFDGGVQCEGFARKIFYEIFGQRISGLASNRRYDKGNIKVGDYVHFTYPHAGVVLSRSGDTLELVECNFSGDGAYHNCWIRWGGYRYYNVNDVEYFIHAPNYDTVDGGSSTTPPAEQGIAWTASVSNITETNATVSARITVPSSVQFQYAGCHICDRQGTIIAKAGEYPSVSGTYMDIWYDITADTWEHVSLKPGTEYKYRFYATYGGEDHFSPLYSFKTAGTHTHTYTPKVTKNATCTVDGIRTCTCAECGDSYTESIPAAGHKWDNGVVTKAATASENGVKTYTCSVCKATKPEVIKASGGTADTPKKPGTSKPSKGAVIKNVSGGNFKVTVKGKSVEFTGLSGSKTSAVIPDKIKSGGVTYKVTSIAANALKNNKKITKAVIGKNVQKIGAGAFSGCIKLKTVTFGAGVKTIGKQAFYKCKALTKITLSSGVRTIGKQAFYGCAKMKNITVKAYATVVGSIGKQAFSGVYKKVTVKVPKKNFAVSKAVLSVKGMPAKAVYKKL